MKKLSILFLFFLLGCEDKATFLECTNVDAISNTTFMAQLGATLDGSSLQNHTLLASLFPSIDINKKLNMRRT